VEYDIRYAGADEFPAVAQLDGASFGFQYSDDELECATLDVELDTVLVAVDSGRIVGASAEVPFTMTLPGGAVDATGLSWVSVEVTHRRRGILRALVETQLRTFADNGVPVAILVASEGGIYGRYGFGVATHTRTTSIDRQATRLLDPPVAHGVVRMSTDDARAVLPAIYDRWRRATPGGLDRNERRWTFQLLDRDWQRGGKSALFHLVHPDGYMSYRIGQESGPTGPRNVCSLVDYVIRTPAAHAGLWHVLLGMDLCARIESSRIPADDPLPLLITDPRQLTTTAVVDALWARPLDVPALLSARTYALELDVVLGVRDPLLGDGTYRLRGGPDGAVCSPVDAAPHAELGVADVGAVLLGGTRVATLARAGRVTGDPATLTRLDRAFLADVEPQLGTYF
jgi:predicted acetyltransferase